MLLQVGFDPDGVLLDVAMGASSTTNAESHMVVGKLGRGKAMSGFGESS